MPALRCPYCHGNLLDEPFVRCSDCGTNAHVGCLGEHGGCPILGCGSRPTAAQAPGRVSWDELVREASPWLEFGASMVWGDAGLAWDPLAWGLLGDPTTTDSDGPSSSRPPSSSRAA